MARKILLSLVLAALVGVPVVHAQKTIAETGNVVVVKMIDKSATEFAFEPAAITVNPGDVVRFEQTVATPHNVDFRGGPEGKNLKGTVSDYLLQPGQTWEITIDERFGMGVHEYVCTPHEMMGMKGTITVEAAQ